jgi:hypothetical protein
MTDDQNRIQGTFIVQGVGDFGKHENEVDVTLVDEFGRTYDGLYLRVDITSVPVETRKRLSKPMTIPDEVMRRLWEDIQAEEKVRKPN